MRKLSIAYQIHPQGLFVPVVQVTVTEKEFYRWYVKMREELNAFINNNNGLSWSLLTE
jgi:hypothetical protein